MKNGTNIWFKTGNLSSSPGSILSNAGDGFFWVRHKEKGTIHYCFLLDIKEIK